MTTNRITLHPAILATLAVLGLTVYVLQNFLLPLIWGSILAMATWPVFVRLQVPVGKMRASLYMTVLVGICLVVPLIWLSNVAFHELGGAAAWAKKISHQGIPYPAILDKLPSSDAIHAWWNKNLAHSEAIHGWFDPLVTERLYAMSHLLQISGVWLLHRMTNLMFSLLALFFFFLNGDRLSRDLVTVCEARLGRRWVASLLRIPVAVRGTVDGIVLVGAAIGLLVGFGYAAVGVRSPVLLGVLTAAAALIPLAASIVYTTVALYLCLTGEILHGILLFVWGHAVFLLFDHLLRPMIIGNTTRMPFLLVLFGVLGGVETMGFVGLFVGPVAMVLLLTWWQTELAVETDEIAPALADQTDQGATTETER